MHTRNPQINLIVFGHHVYSVSVGWYVDRQPRYGDTFELKVLLHVHTDTHTLPMIEVISGRWES